MHGLINRSIQCFLRDAYGAAAWSAIAADANLGIDNFEAMLCYETSDTDAILEAASKYTGNPREMMLEDLGTYLASHENMHSPRRLLRFGGETFVEFLHSLDELHDRARLAVTDLDMPMMELRDHASGKFSLSVTHSYPGFGHVVVGVMRALADDYGTLVFMECQGRKDDVEMVSIDVLETCFAEGNDFALSSNAA